MILISLFTWPWNICLRISIHTNLFCQKKKNYPFSQKEKKENSKKQKESRETQIRPTQTFSLPILQPNKLQDSSLN